MTTGERIKRRRKELGISVDELAKRIGKNRATVYRYESNAIENMPVDVLTPVADALYCTPAYLMGWEEDDKEYYIDKEAAELAEFLKSNPEYRILFDASRKVKKEDIEKVAQMVKLLSD